MAKLILLLLIAFAVGSYAKICSYQEVEVEVPEFIDCEKDFEALETYRFPPITFPPVWDWIRTMLPPIFTRPRTTPEPDGGDDDREECPEEGIKLISHPKSCEKYILCFGGVEIERNCADGLHFSREQRACVDPEDADCEEIKKECPDEDDPENIVFFPNTEDCSKYYVCFGGEKIPLSCGDGLHWSVHEDACLDKDEAKCEFDDDDREECPDEGIKLISHPTNCEKYILCFGGVEIERECPGGLHFSRETRSCVDPDEAGCEEGKKECPDEDDPDNLVFFPNSEDCSKYFVCFGGEKISLSCGVGLHWNADEETCMDKSEAGCEDSDREECPETGVKQISHPTNCGKYILCFGGNEIERECPAGLHFSRETRTCMDPRDAGCEEELFECPDEDDPDNLVFFPNVEDCAKYYLCFGGEKIPLSCGRGLHWSVEENQCLSKADANCEFHEGREFCPETGIHQISHPFNCEKYILCFGGNEIERFCAPGFHFSRIYRSCVDPDIAECEEGEDGKDEYSCPKEDDPGNLVFIPNVEDCTQYFLCYGGEKHLFSCSHGLHWNRVRNMCMSPADAGCTFAGRSFICPSVDESYYPDPENCNSFIHCINGTAEKDQCSEGFLWSRDLHMCDLAAMVTCN